MNNAPKTEPKMIHRESFLVLGTLMQFTPGTESGEKFAAVWNAFEAHRERIQALSIDQKYYGLSFATGGQGGYDYVAAMATSPVPSVPDALVLREVPAATYAVFACPLAAIGQTKRYIFAEWLPDSGWEIEVAVPVFEQYPAAGDTTSPVLIHVPIRKKPNLQA